MATYSLDEHVSLSLDITPVVFGIRADPIVAPSGDFFNIGDHGVTELNDVTDAGSGEIITTAERNGLHTSHTISDVTGLQDAIDGKSSTDHTHDSRYYTETEVDGKFATDSGHDHDGSNSKCVSYTDLEDVPSEFTPANHSNSSHSETYITEATETDLSFTDVTTANATTSKHGLLPKLAGGITDYLRADGTWSAPTPSFIRYFNVVIPGGGEAIEAGIKDSDIMLPACTINEATLLADRTGSIVIDLWKNTYANFPPTGGDKATKTFEVTTGKELIITSGVIGTGSNGLKFTIEANTSDALSVTASGDTVTIKLADSTDSNNSASAIQTALRGLSTVDGIDVSSMTAEGNDAYDTSPPITVSPAISGVSLAGGTNDDSITASAPMTISDAIKSTDDTLSGWTTSISNGDILRINVDSCTDIESCTLALKLTL